MKWQHTWPPDRIAAIDCAKLGFSATMSTVQVGAMAALPPVAMPPPGAPPRCTPAVLMAGADVVLPARYTLCVIEQTLRHLKAAPVREKWRSKLCAGR